MVVLLPIAWRFGKGSRIRLAIAGADIDNYGQVPHGSPPVFTIGRADSFLDLPCAPTKGGRSRRHPMRRGLAGRQHAAMPGDDPVLAVDSPSFERDSR